MRSRRWRWGVAAGGAVGALAIGGGCGGTSSDAPTDAGAADVTQDAPAPTPLRDSSTPDTAAPVDAGLECLSDADLTTVSVPDASIGDSGASSGTCVACVRSKCAAQLSACQSDCDCRTGVVDAFECLSQPNASLQTCAGGLALNAKAQPLGLCLISGCASACGTGQFLQDGGRDGGDAAPTDAAGGG